MSDNLVPAFQRIFTMDQDRAVLVQVAFYGAYAVLALFTSILVEEFSFRTGILIGLAVYVCGAVLYIPACIRQSFDFYFIGIFVVAVYPAAGNEKRNQEIGIATGLKVRCK